MKIEYAIVSSDSNEMYLDFWPVVRDLWNNVVGIKPILALISDKDHITETNEYIIHEIKAVEGISTAFQSQVIRMYITKFYKGNVCITSDIDMAPLTNRYFNQVVEPFDDNSIVILGADAYKNVQRYPICYNVAKGSTFCEILDLDCTFEEYCFRLNSYAQGWDTDELYFGMMVNKFRDRDRVKLIDRGWTYGMANHRIDRINWIYDDNVLRNRGYIDSHLLRPYKNFKEQVDRIVDILR